MTDRGERGGQAGHEAGRGVRRPPGRHGRDREGVARQDRPAQSDVVTLYQGGLYHLYRYKKYTDVRLVFAPEQAIAVFGGDVDNFEFPRFNLDVCFFRAYEDGKPAKVAALLQVERDGAGGGRPRLRHRPPGHDQPAGHAGQAQAPPRRDAAVHAGTGCARWRRLLTQFGERGPEKRAAWRRRTCTASPTPARRSAASTRGCSTRTSCEQKAEATRQALSRARSGRATVPKPLRTADACDGAIAERAGDARRVRAASTTCSRRGDALRLASCSRIARHLRPAGRRDAEAERRAAARVPRLEPRLAEVPAVLARRRSTRSWSGPSWPASLTFLAEQLGGEHPLVVKVLAGKSPAAAGRRADRRHEARRPGRAQAAGRGRARRRSTRVDDPMIALGPR